MKRKELFQLYEKLYFHEIDAREKITARQQVPLAILLAMTSVYAFIAKGISTESEGLWANVFAVSLVVSVLLFITSVFFWVRAFYGHTYEFIPSASTTEDYRQRLINTYAEYDKSKSLVSRHFQNSLFDYYSRCSTTNSNVNDKRSGYLHKCNTFLILNVVPLIVVFLIFNFNALDKNAVDKEIKVSLTNPVMLDIPQTPLQVHASLDGTTLKVHLPKNIEDAIRERQTETAKTTPTASASTDEVDKGGRKDSDPQKPNTEEMR